jgi:hypothetical protein
MGNLECRSLRGGSSLGADAGLATLESWDAVTLPSVRPKADVTMHGCAPRRGWPRRAGAVRARRAHLHVRATLQATPAEGAGAARSERRHGSHNVGGARACNNVSEAHASPSHLCIRVARRVASAAHGSTTSRRAVREAARGHGPAAGGAPPHAPARAGTGSVLSGSWASVHLCSRRGERERKNRAAPLGARARRACGRASPRPLSAEPRGAGAIGACDMGRARPTLHPAHARAEVRSRAQRWEEHVSDVRDEVSAGGVVLILSLPTAAVRGVRQQLSEELSARHTDQRPGCAPRSKRPPAKISKRSSLVAHPVLLLSMGSTPG